MKRTMSITVRGNRKRWCFDFSGDPKYLEEWRADGLDIVVIENTIPVWVVTLGLVRPWCWLQDVFNFKNPWRTK